MIIEHAFVALPELLLGNHYAVQDYEAGIVGVLSMAILQERFDAFSVSLDKSSFQIHANRVTWESAKGAYAQIAKIVSDKLGIVKPSET